MEKGRAFGSTIRPGSDDDLDMAVDVQPGPGGSMRIDAAVMERLEWPLQHLTPEQGTTATVPLLSVHGNGVVDLRTPTLIVEDAQDRLDAVRAMLEHREASAESAAERALVVFVIADVSREWIAVHRSLLPPNCAADIPCAGALLAKESMRALNEALEAGVATDDARIVERPAIHVQVGQTASVQSKLDASESELGVDVLVVPDANGTMQAQHHVRWTAAAVDARGSVPVSAVGITLIPLGGDRDGRIALIASSQFLAPVRTSSWALASAFVSTRLPSSPLS